ncbi:MAG: hypothetical protein WBQ21_10670 [Solirubrobacteraceae bacterium]
MSSTKPTGEAIREIVQGQGSLLEAAIGCKINGYTPLECAKELYENRSTPTAAELAGAIVSAWGCIVSSATLTAALQSCQAWDAPTIAAATSAALHLTWLDDAEIGGSLLHTIGLFKGDLTTMASAESVPVLVISTLPGDYQNVPGSMIAALAAHGVSVASLAQHMALDRRSQNGCWLSQTITGQSFSQLLVLETTGDKAIAAIPGVMTTLQAALPTPTSEENLTIACSMLSTGSAGANPSQVLTALFGAAKAAMSSGYALAGCKIVNYQQGWDTQLTGTFHQLKAGV